MAIQSYKLLTNWDDPASTSQVFDRICPSTSVVGSYHRSTRRDHLELFVFQVFAQQKLRHKKDLLIFDPYMWLPEEMYFSHAIEDLVGEYPIKFLESL